MWAHYSLKYPRKQNIRGRRRKQNLKSNNGNMSAGKEMDVNGSQSFSSVSSLVTGWTLDFMFISLCRYFKEGNLDKFNEILATFEGM